MKKNVKKKKEKKILVGSSSRLETLVADADAADAVCGGRVMVVAGELEMHLAVSIPNPPRRHGVVVAPALVASPCTHYLSFQPCCLIL